MSSVIDGPRQMMSHLTIELEIAAVEILEFRLFPFCYMLLDVCCDVWYQFFSTLRIRCSLNVQNARTAVKSS